MTYYVDRKRVKDYKEALDYGKINFEIVNYFEFDPDDSLAVGEKDWLLKYAKPRKGKAKQKDLEDFADFIDQHLAIKVTYSSIMEDTVWEKCSTKDRC